MTVRKDASRNYNVVINAGTNVESLAQLVTRNQFVLIRVDTPQKYHVTQV